MTGLQAESVDWRKNLNMSPDFIIMTPVVCGADENTIRVDRYGCADEVPTDILLAAGGPHAGILVRRRPTDVEPAADEWRDGLDLAFNVFLIDASSGDHKQENRQLRFWFQSDVCDAEKHLLAQQFFKSLLANFPNDYVGFIKLVMKLMQGGYEQVRRVDLVMRLVQEAAQAPESKEYGDSGSEIESVTIGHVQEILERAYPNGLSVASMAVALRCTVEEVDAFLADLKENGVAKQTDADEWIRVADMADEPPARAGARASREDEPTVAIITALFVEKLAVDAMIENKRTMHRYKSDGESNVYTLGTIGSHRVVATKLSAVGHTRAAMTAAGSITTRLLGNFQRVEHVFVCGVGGAVPHYTDAEQHVRLGDVVVSAAADTRNDAAYVYCEKLDLNRETEAVVGFSARHWAPKDGSIEQIARQLGAPGEMGDNEGGVAWAGAAAAVEAELNAAMLSGGEYSFTRPPPDSDTLTVPIGDGNVVAIAQPDERAHPRLHLGAVGAGRAALREAALRQEFAAKFDLRACDGEFDSVVEAIIGSRCDSWALVRGAADYADGMRNRQWQAYAALQAAAVTKLLIEQLAPAEQDG